MIAALALTWFVRRCLRHSDPLLEVRLFRHPAFTAGIIGLVSNSLALATTMLLIALSDVDRMRDRIARRRLGGRYVRIPAGQGREGFGDG